MKEFPHVWCRNNQHMSMYIVAEYSREKRCDFKSFWWNKSTTLSWYEIDIKNLWYQNYTLVQFWYHKSSSNFIEWIYYKASDAYKYISCKTREIKYMLPLVSKCWQYFDGLYRLNVSYYHFFVFTHTLCYAVALNETIKGTWRIKLNLSLMSKKYLCAFLETSSFKWFGLWAITCFYIP